MGEWKGTCEVEIGLNNFVPSRPVLPPSLLSSIPPSPPTLQLKQGFFPVPLQVVQVLPPSGLACRRAIPLVKEGREGGREIGWVHAVFCRIKMPGRLKEREPQCFTWRNPANPSAGLRAALSRSVDVKSIILQSSFAMPQEMSEPTQRLRPRHMRLVW